MSDEFNVFRFSGGEDGIPPEIKKILKGLGRHEELKRDTGSEIASRGFSDISEAMHIMNEAVSASPNLNIGAMLQLSEVFSRVFEAAVTVMEPPSKGDPHFVSRVVLSDCGIVGADGNNLDRSPPGGIEMADLQIIAAMAAIRFFLFSRMRKLQTCIPFINEMVANGNLDGAYECLKEGMTSASTMMNCLDKMGMGVVEEHPVAVKMVEGLKESMVLLKKIAAMIKERDEKAKEG